MIAQGLDSEELAGAAAAGAAAATARFSGARSGADRRFRRHGPAQPVGFQAIAQARHKFGGRAIGEYIVSGARGPEDILAVLLLARWADITDKRSGECPLDVAPLLESIDSLETAGELLRALHAEPAYRRHLESRGNRQMVVIGYSDTNKQGGIAASRWALQVAQVQLLEAARATGIRLLIFHGRGGTPARGGGRTEHLVESLPNGAMRGVLRLTEQGEVVNQSYGLRPIAMRTLERTFASVALATAHAARRRPIAPEQFAAMQSDCGAKPQGLSRAGVRQRGIFRIFPRRDAARCHRAHAHRVAARGARGRRRRAGAAGDSLGVRMDAEPAHAAGLVRIRQRRAGRAGAARRGGHRPHDGALAVLQPFARRCGGHAGTNGSGYRQPLRCAGAG